MIARQSTAVEYAIGPVLDATGVAVTDCVVADFKLKKTTGNFAALNGSATLAHVSAGMYDLVMTTSDTDTVGAGCVAIDDGVNSCSPLRFQVVEEAVYDMLYAASAVGYVANAPVTLAASAIDAILDDACPEVSAIPAAGAITIREAISIAVMAILSGNTATATTRTLKKRDGTSVGTAARSDDGVTYSQGTMA